MHLPEMFRAVFQLLSPSHLRWQWDLFAFCSAWMDLMTLLNSVGPEAGGKQDRQLLGSAFTFSEERSLFCWAERI